MRSCGWCGVSIEHKRSHAKTCSRNCNYSLWVSRNPHRHKEITSKWQKGSPDKYANIRKGADSRRRARVRGAEQCAVATRDWDRQVDRQRGLCFYCGNRKPLTMDHVVPLARGGRHSIGNIVAACQTCNSSKRDRLITEWSYNRFPAVEFLRTA